MRLFYDLKTRSKVLVGFLAVLGLTAGLGGYSIYQLAQVNDSTVEIATTWLPCVDATSDINTVANVFRINELGHVRATTPERMQYREAQLEETLKRIKTVEEAYVRLITSDRERAIYDEFRSAWSSYLAEHEQILSASRAGRKDEATARLDSKSKEFHDLARVKLRELGDLNIEGAKAAQAHAQAAYTSARMWTVGILVVALGLGVGLAFLIGGMISRPLNKTVGVLNTVASGDFNVQLDIDTKDEVGQMAVALNRTVESVRTSLEAVRGVLEKVAAGDFTAQVDVEAEQTEVGRMSVALNKTIVAVRGALSDVRSVADAVATASAQLSSGSEEISSGAQEQASSLEETASSLEEITSTVRQNADNAEQANQLAGGARDAADKGGAVVAAAVAAMGEINESSRKIAAIITTIDEIAFQTNLLALNAAVEAARAGEQGRGFAVVAGEVRNLAQRSAGAAKEIKELIGDSVRKVEAGTDLVNKSGETLAEIVGSVKRVTDIVGEIAAACREQSSGIEQVNKAVTQMDTVTQANASQTEELSGTAESLSGQARELQSLVARFQLGGDAAGKPTGQTAKPATTPAAAKAKPATSVRPTSRKPATAGPQNRHASERELDLVGAIAGDNRLNSHFEEF